MDYEKHTAKIGFFLAGIIWIVALSLMSLSAAAGYYDIDINYPTRYVTTITDGINDDELSQGVTTAIAAGSHQFDWSTYRWQGSVVGAFELDTESNAVAFGVAKRFESIDALWHGGWIQDGSDDYISLGATFRF